MAVEVTLAPVVERPSVSVVVPFAGSAAELSRLLDSLSTMALRPGDELIVADNRAAGRSPAAASSEPARTAVRLVPARGIRTPAYARNRGAREASGTWLVFIDADTTPSPSLLDAYFDPVPEASTAVLAGGIVDVAASGSLAARHSASREQMSDRATLERAGRPYAQTANCAVLRSAFVATGGFEETARAGEDADLCFRLALAGWGLERRTAAGVSHRTRETLPALLSQVARHGSGAAWLNRRYPGEFAAPGPRELAARFARDGGAALAALRRGDREAASMAALEIVTGCAFELGRLLPNRPRRSA
jgi:GT2 family glycosyltransferase